MTEERENGGRAPVNQGIQAGSVQADVLAVGTGARASKTVNVSGGDQDELREAIQGLRAAVDALVADPGAREIVRADVSALEEAVAEESVSQDRAQGILKGLADKLRMAGVVVTNAEEFMKPALRIAKTLGFTLGAIGLL